MHSSTEVIVACCVLYNICKQQNDIVEIEEVVQEIHGENEETDQENFINQNNQNNPNYATRNALIATTFNRL